MSVWSALYDALKTIRSKEHFLQRVGSVKRRDTTLVVTLSPIGFVLRPDTIKEVRTWLACMLTALRK